MHPDLELRAGRGRGVGDGFVSFAMLAFLSSVISCCFFF